jgi:hypothetical protein
MDHEQGGPDVADSTTPHEGDKNFMSGAATALLDLIDRVGVEEASARLQRSLEPSTPICDVCLRRRITRADLDAFPDGTSVAEIKQAIGEPSCLFRASGPCVNLGWERVRELKNLIRSAIADRGSDD